MTKKYNNSVNLIAEYQVPIPRPVEPVLEGLEPWMFKNSYNYFKTQGINMIVTDNRFRELDKRQIFKDSVAKKDEKKDKDKDKGKGDKKY